MNKFRAHGEEELPNLELRGTKDDAFLLAVNRLSEEAVVGEHPQKIVIEELREPKLSDFFDFAHLIGVMRESMASKIGNDDALTDDAVAMLRARNNGAIEETLDDIAELIELRFDGMIVINRWVIDRWWVKDTGDA